MCLRLIPAGAKMHYFVGKWEGDFCSSHTCSTCQEITSYSVEREFPEGFVYEMLSTGETPEQFLNSIIQIKQQAHDYSSQSTN